MAVARRSPERAPTLPGEDPLVGVEIGQGYRLLRRMAEGSTAAVYEADHPRLPLPLAVKVLARKHMGRAALEERFVEEAKTLARVRSPHVLAVYDLTETPDGRPAIVCERLVGETLQAHLERVREVSIPFAVRVAREVCAALVAAHAMGIVHRDIKPANIFLEVPPGGTMRVKLLDFGIARNASAEPVAATPNSARVSGTPAYMAPEQARGDASPDVRTDVYGVGALLYRLLSGRAPHTGPDALAVLHHVRHNTPASLRSFETAMPEGLVRAVESAMERETRLRPASIKQLDALLAPFDPRDAGTILDEESFATRSEPSAGESTVILPGGAVERSGAKKRVMAMVEARALRDAYGLSAAASCAAALALRLWGLSPVALGVAAVALGGGVAFGLRRVVTRAAHRPGRLDIMRARLGTTARWCVGMTGAVALGLAAWSAFASETRAVGAVHFAAVGLSLAFIVGAGAAVFGAARPTQRGGSANRSR
jgi:serine/threonine protein kinase